MLLHFNFLYIFFIYLITIHHFYNEKTTFKKRTTAHHRGKGHFFSYLHNFEPEAKIQSNDRGNGFKLLAIKT